VLWPTLVRACHGSWFGFVWYRHNCHSDGDASRCLAACRNGEPMGQLHRLTIVCPSTDMCFLQNAHIEEYAVSRPRSACAPRRLPRALLRGSRITTTATALGASVCLLMLTSGLSLAMDEGGPVTTLTVPTETLQPAGSDAVQTASFPAPAFVLIPTAALALSSAALRRGRKPESTPNPRGLLRNLHQSTLQRQTRTRHGIRCRPG
jgi:hypothetical protein